MHSSFHHSVRTRFYVKHNNLSCQLQVRPSAVSKIRIFWCRILSWNVYNRGFYRHDKVDHIFTYHSYLPWHPLCYNERYPLCHWEIQTPSFSYSEMFDPRQPFWPFKVINKWYTKKQQIYDSFYLFLYLVNSQTQNR